ncbi:von Willebrand factor A domain-containing protein 5B1 [Cottoperca gobio]|uniref:von Willebrand factor A domain-containing protein 5B1 n=1 Tax=Cottoperca gobio TaxID=56716 RepID=A0A6J2PEJ0_COTGO|nr:von Willebrand factor A domain-containing protein 5B1 [Cottoperca gobio]
MVVILKSLLPGCLFNIIGFGSTFKSLFTTSQNYEEDALALACEYVKKIQADMGGTNILAPLSWILRQPMFSGHPRLLFLLTDGAVSNTGSVIELVRSHARYIRCFTFGIGQTACRRLVQGLALVSRGSAEFLSDGERLQPKMIKSLKKTLSPVLSDISIEWLFPETKEVLLSPVGNSFLFPGDSLIGYSVVCDTTRYHTNPKSDKRMRYSMMRSIESASSVFYHSQEEDPLRAGDSQCESCRDSMSHSPAPAEQDPAGLDCQTSPRRRAYSTNQITDYNSAKKTLTPSDPSSVGPKNPLRRAKVQELLGQTSPDHEARWRSDYQPQPASLCAGFSSRGLPAGSQWPLLKQEASYSELHPLAAGIMSAGDDGSRSSSDSPSVGSVGDTDGYGHQLCQAETLQEVRPSDPGAADPLIGDCKAVVSGLLCGRAASWEVVFDIEPFLSGREREEKVHEELWNETFHHMAGRSIIRDFENMADKESSGRKYQLYAVHTSKACNILSKHTAFVPVDLDTNEYLQTCIEYMNPGEGLKRGSRSSSRSGSRKTRGYSVGLGRSQSGGVSEDELLHNSGEDGVSPCSTPTSAGWERCSFTEVSQRSPSVTSDQSQKSVESFFSARLALTRTRLLTRAAKGFMCRSHSKSGESGESDTENKDYIPLVLLQLASGAFPLDAALCYAINVPMEKLKWTSPFSNHRSSLAHPSHCSSRRADHGFGSLCEPETELTVGMLSPPHYPSSLGSPCSTGEPLLSQADSGRGSGSGGLETASLKRLLDAESMVWATAVALAWLEHSSASHFIEWELAAAKASMWLTAQEIPEGRDLASVKAAANQLFIILRHWDENLQLNMLCYNPNSV